MRQFINRNTPRCSFTTRSSRDARIAVAVQACRGQAHFTASVSVSLGWKLETGNWKLEAGSALHAAQAQRFVHYLRTLTLLDRLRPDTFQAAKVTRHVRVMTGEDCNLCRGWHAIRDFNEGDCALFSNGSRNWYGFS